MRRGSSPGNVSDKWKNGALHPPHMRNLTPADKLQRLAETSLPALCSDTFCTVQKPVLHDRTSDAGSGAF